MPELLYKIREVATGAFINARSWKTTSKKGRYFNRQQLSAHLAGHRQHNDIYKVHEWVLVQYEVVPTHINYPIDTIVSEL